VYKRPGFSLLTAIHYLSTVTAINNRLIQLNDDHDSPVWYTNTFTKWRWGISHCIFVIGYLDMKNRGWRWPQFGK